MPTRGDKFAVVYVDGDVPQRPIQLGQLLVDTTLVSPGTPVLLQCTDVDPVTYEALAGGSGTGTVTNVATGTGLTGGPITTTGTVALSAGSIASLASADSAVQPGDDVSDLVNDAGYLTSASLPAATSNYTLRYVLFGVASGATEVGLTTTVVGTQTSPAPTATDAFTRAVRRNYAATTAVDNGASARNSLATEGPIGASGTIIELIFGLNVTATGQRIMVGFRGATTLVSASTDPSALTDSIFLGKDVADTDLQIMHNDAAGTCTKVPITGVTPASLAGHLLRLTLTTAVGGASVHYELYDYNTVAVVASGNLSTNLPGAAVQQYPCANVSSANTGVAVSFSATRFTSMALIG